MSQLIQLRNRIRAIETIKKNNACHAFISMSAHTRLRSKDENFRLFYLNTLRSLTGVIKKMSPTWHHPRFTPVSHQEPRNLVILIGSQRGLCGNFNTSLFYFFENTINPNDTVIIPIGKKAVNFISSSKYTSTLAFPNLSIAESNTIVQQIIEYVMNEPEPFTSVSVVSNKIKSFFIQKPQVTTLIPYVGFSENYQTGTVEYIWEQDPADLLTHLLTQTMHSHLQYLIFQSLLAEQAARFISMDNATRNAQGILDTTKLSYNKLRQAKITKELTELSGTLFRVLLIAHKNREKTVSLALFLAIRYLRVYGFDRLTTKREI